MNIKLSFEDIDIFVILYVVWITDEMWIIYRWRCQCSFKNENSIISLWRVGGEEDIKIVTMKSPGCVFWQLSQERTAALTAQVVNSKYDESYISWKLTADMHLCLRWRSATSVCIDLLLIHQQNEQ